MRVRAVVRVALFAALTAATYGACLLGMPVAALFRNGAVRWRNLVARAWARGGARAMGMRLTVAGPLPTPPFLLVANHLSYMDIVALASQVDAVFVAKSEVARWPVVGRLCGDLGTIFIDRRRRRDILRVNALIAEALAAGRGVVMFPEATSTAGASLLPFHSSLLAPAARANLAVHYAALHYRTPPGAAPAHMAVCWWGGMDFFPHLFALGRLPHFDATITFGAQTIHHHNRKALAQLLHAAVEHQWTPTVQADQELHDLDVYQASTAPSAGSL